MMKKLLLKDTIPHRTSVSLKRLTVVFVVSILLISLWQLNRQKVPNEHRAKLIEAAKKMAEATTAVARFRSEKKVPMNVQLDPNRTGWIGDEYTPLTTTLGNLEAKQTSLNPDFAALAVRWLLETGAQPGDTVALQLSGSFPALNIASIIACEVIGIQPLIAASAGASSYGANRPDFTYPEIENYLFGEKIIHHRSAMMTYGSEKDRGLSLSEEGREIIRKALAGNKYVLTVPPDLHTSIRNKWTFFRNGKNIRLFINVGGNQTALGSCSHSSSIPTGLLLNYRSCSHSGKGLIMYFREKNIPVIHFLDIRSLALSEGMPIAPSPLPVPGSGSVYYLKKDNSVLTFFLALITLSSWLILIPGQIRPFSFRTTSTSIS